MSTVEILNEIHAARTELPEPIFGAVHPLVDEAKKRANGYNPERDGYYYRPNLVQAAALLVQAIEALDRADEDERF